MEVRYSLESVQNQIDREILLDQLYYLSRNIQKVAIEDDYIVMTFQGDQEAVILDKLDQLIHKLTQWRKIPIKVLKDNTASQPNKANHTELKNLDSDLLREEVVYLYEIFNTLLRKVALNNNAKLRKYSSLLSKDLIIQSGYLSHFPQNVFRMSNIEHSQEIINEFKTDIEQDGDASSHFSHTDYFLQPCVCYHVYHEYRNTTQHSDLEVITTTGTCFRNEHRLKISPFRYRDFTMQEVVYIGEDQAVQNLRMKLLEEYWGLFEELGFSGYIQTAKDPFFISDDMGKSMYQLAGDLKYELRFSLGKTIDFAITSFNLCGDVLCKSFNIQQQGRGLFSGCTAHGLDRWVKAFVLMHGTDSKNWPSMIRELV